VAGNLIVVLTSVGVLVDAWLYDPSTDKWTKVAEPPIAARQGAAIAVASGKVVVWGGLSLDSFHVFSDGAVLDTVANRWTPTGGAIAARNLQPEQVAADPASTLVFIFGGRSATGENASDWNYNGGVFDVATGTWAAIPPMPQTTRPASLYAFGSHMVGLTTYERDPIAVYDATARAWTALARLPCAMRQSPLTPYAIYKNKLLVGGSDGIGGLSLYDLDTGTGVSLDGAVSPVVRPGAAAVWMTDRLVVRGGSYDQWTCPDDTFTFCQLTRRTQFANGFTLTW